jgi:hypothetical protein
MSLRPISIDEFAADIPRRPVEECGPAPQLQWLDIALLVVDPGYQRDITAQGKRNVKRIAEQFDWRYFSPVIVAPIAGGRYAVVDGQHRATAAMLCGHAAVPCQVIMASPGEQAKAFTAVNGTVTRVHTLAMHKAAVAAGDEVAREVERVAKAGGAKILAYPVPELKQAPGQTMAIGALRDLIQEYGAEATILGLRSVTETSNAVRGGLTAPIVKAVGRLAAMWLVQDRRPAAFIAAIGELVLIREADKAARNDREPGEATANALARRLGARLGLSRPAPIKVPA